MLWNHGSTALTNFLQHIPPHNQIRPPAVPRLRQFPRHHQPSYRTSPSMPLTRGYYSTTLSNSITLMFAKRASPTAKLSETDISSPTTVTYTNNYSDCAKSFSQRLFPLHNHCCIQQSHVTNTKRNAPLKIKHQQRMAYTSHSLSPITHIIRQHWHILQSDDTLSQLFPHTLFLSYTRHHWNIKDMLVHSKFSTTNSPCPLILYIQY